MKFIPSENIEGLRRQAFALDKLARSKEAQCSILQANLDEAQKQLKSVSQEAINAERDTNEKLTAYIHELERERDDADRRAGVAERKLAFILEVPRKPHDKSAAKSR